MRTVMCVGGGGGERDNGVSGEDKTRDAILESRRDEASEMHVKKRPGYKATDGGPRTKEWKFARPTGARGCYRT